MSTSRQVPWWQPMRSRLPTTRNLSAWCSARLAAFSPKIPDWIVQIPASSAAAMDGDRQGAGHAADPLLGRLPQSGVQHLAGDDVADPKAAAGLEHTERLGQHGGLVAGQVDHAVRDDHVDRSAGQRDGLDGAVQELDVAGSGLGRGCNGAPVNPA
jgi:hypothetical protein